MIKKHILVQILEICEDSRVLIRDILFNVKLNKKQEKKLVEVMDNYITNKLIKILKGEIQE